MKRRWAILWAVASLASSASGWTQAVAGENGLGRLRAVVETSSARDAIARVTWAEAAGQGDSGLAGVVYTILNRLASGRWGDQVDAVVNARGQFEPVSRAGGDWRTLPPVSAARQARVDTILNLALDGRLPDPTSGALFFQNPKIVAARAAAGAVSQDLVNFGGRQPSVTIGDHAFYGPEPSRGGQPVATAPASPGERGLFVLADGSIVEDHP
ncbi:cell wall hydrolase [Caulobacter rhizosphaerae]|uniref:cell wall hydrolase n=1 Tax=Caulobacter rhizosphaerae TaxID=2010972 RepID=UPI0013D8A3E7|nr:cell wall hydrolase [Caulobacter rhizosphaerae]GGL35846.1 hypothetical protein GCM10010983_36070 [Caulobacter rhizosphaerae]